MLIFLLTALKYRHQHQLFVILILYCGTQHFYIYIIVQLIFYTFIHDINMSIRTHTHAGYAKESERWILWSMKNCWVMCTCRSLPQHIIQTKWGTVWVSKAIWEQQMKKMTEVELEVISLQHVIEIYICEHKFVNTWRHKQCRKYTSYPVLCCFLLKSGCGINGVD